MKKVLIIGANSYIGKKFNSYVQNNHINNLSVFLVSASDGSWKSIDFKSFDCILHLAAIAHRKENKKLKKIYHDINYKLAVDVAHLAKMSGVRQFIFMSTAAVYNPGDRCITKYTKPNPKSYYGFYKLMAEEEICKMGDNLFKIVIVRSPMVYGEGCKGNYQKLKKLARFLPIFPDYHNKRSMIHIDNFCKFLIDVIINEKNGIFFPQDKKYIDTCEMFVELRNKIGKRTRLTKVLNFLIKLLIPYSKTFSKLFGDFYYMTDTMSKI